MEETHSSTVAFKGVKTLRTQDTSDPRHFGTIRLVPNCLDLDNTFLVQYMLMPVRASSISHLYSIAMSLCVRLLYFVKLLVIFLDESELKYICAIGRA